MKNNAPVCTSEHPLELFIAACDLPGLDGCLDDSCAKDLVLETVAVVGWIAFVVVVAAASVAFKQAVPGL